MPHQTEAALDTQLAEAFDANAFDIVGLAEFPADQNAVDRSLRDLYRIVRSDVESSTENRERLANVLLAMTAVARDDYAASGHQEYWPFLFSRIREATFADPEKFWTQSLNPQQQRMLGKWFCDALDAFGYSIPNDGQRYVGPIVFHAGVPNASLPGVLQVISSACEQYGDQTITLPADIRASVVQHHTAPLHQNAKRLLASNLQGASQLWSCLARVVLAWHSTGDCSEELKQLPLALDAEAVRRALPGKTTIGRQPRTKLPQLRFDPETGEVRVCLPLGTQADWHVQDDDGDVSVRWNQTHLGLTAEFLGPLPEKLFVKPRNGLDAAARTFTTRCEKWPGFWFNAQTGNIQDAATIDVSGLEAGRWFALIEGTPTDVPGSVPVQVSLKWSWFAGQTQWTAWEVTVPPRSQSQTHIEWYIDDIHFSVKLARRPGPIVKCVCEPLATSTLPSGQQVDVFSQAPVVVLQQDQPLSVVLLRETDSAVSVVERFTLPANANRSVPVTGPGVYQLREVRGVGRNLLHFAVVPGFTATGPVYNADRTTATIDVSVAENSGCFLSLNDNEIERHEDRFQFEASTVQPSIALTWHWHDSSIPELTFRWPLEGLRWRVLRLDENAARWTREPVFISPKEVQKQDAQFEVQIPNGTELSVNDTPFAGKLKQLPAGSAVTLSLLPYSESVVITNAGQKLPAVVLSERPLFDSLRAMSDGDSMLLEWSADRTSQETVVVAWNPLEPLQEPKTFPLDFNALAAGQWEVACSQLPGTAWTSLSLARSIRFGFREPILHLAAQRNESLRPLAVLVDRTSGTATGTQDEASNWIEFLHGATFGRLDHNLGDSDSLRSQLASIHKVSPVDLTAVVRFSTRLLQLQRSEGVTENSQLWLNTLRHALNGFLQRCSMSASSELVSDESSFQTLLQIGVPVGRSCPHQWLSETAELPDTVAYPFNYIRDLWLLGTTPGQFEEMLQLARSQESYDYPQMQREAARRVWRFHEQWGLTGLASVLPIAQSMATAESTEPSHCHSFALPPVKLVSAEDFEEILGLDDKALDCDGTCDDQFYWEPGNGRAQAQIRRPRESALRQYSLFWNDDDCCWVIDRLKSGKSYHQKCCETTSGPLLTAPWTAQQLQEKLELRRALTEWSSNNSLRDGETADFRFLDELQPVLFADKVLGDLHREILISPEAETKELFGKVVEVPGRRHLPEPALIAWQLAWIDRLCAWQGPKQFFGDEPATVGVHATFLSALARACRKWPDLMRRCLALTEFLYWIVHRHGLGSAVRFDGFKAPPRQSTSTPSRPARIDANDSLSRGDDSPVVATGVIVSYHNGQGVLLLHRPETRTLETTVLQYVRYPESNDHWLIPFGWGMIEEEDRRRLHRNRGGKTVADRMRGRTARVALIGKVDWEVKRIAIDFSRERFSLPRK